MTGAFPTGTTVGAMALKGTFNLLRSRRGEASLSPLTKQAAVVRRAMDDEADSPAFPLQGKRQLERTLGAVARSARDHAGHDPFDEQILAALGLLNGFGVDMATGEGKTLAAILAAGTWAATDRQVHVLCPNDYLARRDHDLAATILAPLGIGVGVVGEDSITSERQQAYRQSVVHTTVHEIAYDLMRDNLALDPSDLVRPHLDVAVVDEVDAVLLDEATQPLVIARTAASTGAAEELEKRLATLVAGMTPGVHTVADGDAASFTESGIAVLEEELGVDSLFDADQVELATAANLALHADAVLHRDVDYVVEDGQVLLVSSTRGRVVQRQRWPEGLHRAVEVKEGLTDSHRVEVLDQLTIQEVAKAYTTCTGMSGSATLAARELHDRYGLLTARIPQRLALQRIDEPTRLYATADQRDAAALDLVGRAHGDGRPVLVGTQSVAQSEEFAAALTRRGVETTVLNAKNPEDEAAVIAGAGATGRVTISTQMAGRGTDIVLTDDARAAGGLQIVGLECYPSPRLDLQLRGRAGRQGDPGDTVILASLDDPLYGGDLPADGVPTDESGRITLPGALEEIAHRQRAAEGRMLAQHEQAWAFTRTISEHRQVVLASRRHLLDVPSAATRELGRHLEPAEWHDVVELLGAELDQVCAGLALTSIDELWSAHLAHLTALREGIHLRRLARLSPLAEFDKEARSTFENFLLRAARSAADELAESLHTKEIPEFEHRDPGALWAYRVTDPNWGSAEDKFIKFVGERLRGAVFG